MTRIWPCDEIRLQGSIFYFSYKQAHELELVIGKNIGNLQLNYSFNLLL